MKRALGISAVAIIGVIAWVLFNQQGQHSARASGEAETDADAPMAAAKRHEAGAVTKPNGEEKRSAAARRDAPRRITSERRLEIIKALAVAHSAKAAVAEDHETELPPATPPTRLTTKQYIREQMDEIKPLIAECYRTAKTADPALGSTIPVAFKIEGEPGVGGLVTEASLHPSLEKQVALNECVRETLYTLEIDPPEAGGDVSVVYPFDFGEESEE